MKVPHFYCENCGKEVPAKAKICPHCGKFFNDVRCPRCGHIDKVEAFYKGCPKCGYLDPGLAEQAAAAGGKHFEVYNAEVVAEPSRKTREGAGRHTVLLVAAVLGVILVGLVIAYAVILGS